MMQVHSFSLAAWSKSYFSGCKGEPLHRLRRPHWDVTGSGLNQNGGIQGDFRVMLVNSIAEALEAIRTYYCESDR